MKRSPSAWNISQLIYYNGLVSAGVFYVSSQIKPNIGAHEDTNTNVICKHIMSRMHGIEPNNQFMMIYICIVRLEISQGTNMFVKKTIQILSSVGSSLHSHSTIIFISL